MWDSLNFGSKMGLLVELDPKVGARRIGSQSGTIREMGSKVGQ